ncbi:unnamed protein product [Oppiella nova]|uniref:Nuclear receptor n=1 Tax=Oppiella nova TaxID=334625 RepID=A0A7R9LTW2_9ACAR|nr:unnamed protein product [Oppiella nova]CAG2166177.1 unnamed protein product [Oppiella nova]
MYRIYINTEESNENTSSEVTSPDSSQSDNNLQVSSNSIDSTDNTSSLDTSQSYNTETSLDIPDTFEDLDLILDLDFNVEEIDLQANEIETIINGDVIQHGNSTANNTIDVFTDFDDDISELVYQKAIEHEFTVIPISRPTTDHTYVFNELEGFKLTELFGATEIFSETLSVVSVTSMARDYADLVRVLCYKIDEQVMRAIRMSKKLQTFNNICETDRISLLKQGSLELYLIRSVPYYDSVEDHWTYNMGNNTSVILSLELMRVFPRNIYSFYKKFLHNICREWESDLLVLDLLTAIVLFNPDRPKLIDKDLVKLHQHIYMHLLRRYLLVRYRSHPESNVKFLRLLNCLIHLTVLGDVYRLNCADKDPDTIPPSRNMPDPRAEKKCLICGDKAIGNNFDALSCESCKAFFRRNAIKYKQIRCHFGDNCVINVLTRKSCRKCRLEKCLDAGMKQDWLIPNYKPAKKMSKSHQIYQKSYKMDTTIQSPNASSSDRTSPDSSHSSDTTPNNSIEMLDIFDAFDTDFNVEEFNTILKDIEECISVDNPIINHDNIPVLNDIDPDHIPQEHMVEHIARPIFDPMFSLNELEGNRLAQLLNATNFFAEPSAPVAYKAKNFEELRQVLVYRVDQQVVRAMKMLKVLGSAKGVVESDRETLIKQGVLHLFCIRSVPFYDCTQHQWTYNLGNNTSVVISLELMRDFPQNLYFNYKNFLNNICNEWESDPLVLDLLTAITLYNPKRPGLLFKELVRRTALKNKELTCDLKNHCKIDVYSRKCCMKCRLKKCFDVGMRKDLILSRDTKTERKLKIEINKNYRKDSDSGSNDTSDTTSSPESGHQSYEPKDSTLEMPDNFDDLDLDLDIDEINTQIMEIEKLIEEEDHSIYNKAAEQELPLLSIARPFTTIYSFNELETHKLTELFNATSFFNESTAPTSVVSQVLTDRETGRAFMNKFELQFRQVIKMSKALTTFNSISESDRFTLIKEVALDLFSLRVVPYYDPVSRYWSCIMNNGSTVILDLGSKLNKNFYSLRLFLDKISTELETDTIVLDLLTAIVLFNPDRPKLKHKQFVKLQQNTYMYLLERYLAVRYQSQTESTLKFVKLVNCLKDLYAHNAKLKINIKNKDPDHVTPLMKEILDIQEKKLDNNGKNFDALSCESCKAFFRRTALKETEFKCEFNDNCKIDVYTRRFCIKCRLQKCLDIGMKKEMILTSEAKKVRKMKIEMNKTKRKVSDSGVSNTSSDTQSDSGSQSCDTSDNPLKIPDNLDELLDLDLDIDEINTQIMEIEKIIGEDEGVDDESSDDIDDSVYDRAVELEFTLLPIARPVANTYSFNELETNKLAELFNATSFFKESAPTAMVSHIESDQQFGSVMTNLFETQFKRVIQMSKSFTTFNNVYVWLKKFLNKIDKEWETDIIVLDLLTAIVLFNPDRPNLEHKEFVKLQQNTYMYLLQRYLAVRYQSQTESTLKFLKLLNCLKDLKVLSENFRLSMERKDPEHVPPLMREILDVNGKKSDIKCDGCIGATVTTNNIIVF